MISLSLNKKANAPATDEKSKLTRFNQSKITAKTTIKDRFASVNARKTSWNRQKTATKSKRQLEKSLMHNLELPWTFMDNQTTLP